MRVYPRQKRTFYLKLVKKIKTVKRLSFFDKIIFILNSLTALILLVSCMVPFVPADEFPFISVLSLGVPILIAANLLFLLYWLLRRKKQAWLSFSILVLGYFILGSFIGFGSTEDEALETDLKVMSFNVRSFNRYGGIDEPNIFKKTLEFVLEEDPDVICIQEIDYTRSEAFKERYPFQYVRYITNQHRVLMGIFSKFEIVKSSTFDWPNSHNNGSYADIVYEGDTLRVYNLHMESLQITASKESVVKEAKPRLYKKLSGIFKKQSLQAKFFAKRRDSVTYKTIVCGDFNNTQFSNSYRIVKGDMNDTFLEKGSGLGTTYSFLGLPYRIDFILADPVFEVKSHQNYDVKFSDHFPVMASFSLKKD